MAPKSFFILAPARQPRDVDIAFYTKGDTRNISEGGKPIRHSDAWRRRANTLATSSKYVFGVDTVGEAIKKIKSLKKKKRPTRISRVFLIGHGFEGGFFFSGDPIGVADFEAHPANILDVPEPIFNLCRSKSPNGTACADKHAAKLDREEISQDLIDAFEQGQAIALDREGTSVSVEEQGRLWRVTGVVGGPTDFQDFIVERNGPAMEVYDLERFSARKLTRRFLQTLIAQLSPDDHVEVNYLSCFTGEPDREHRLDIFTAAELQRHGFEDFSVGAYIHYYQTVIHIEKSGGRTKTTFLDYISHPTNGRVFVPNPGPNRIPPFERLLGGRSESL